MRKRISLALSFCLLFSCLGVPLQPVYAEGPKSIGIIGNITSQPGFERLDAGTEVLVLPTDSGLYLIEGGKVRHHLFNGQEIRSWQMIDDQDNDGKKDLLISFNNYILADEAWVSSGSGKVLRYASLERLPLPEGFKSQKEAGEASALPASAGGGFPTGDYLLTSGIGEVRLICSDREISLYNITGTNQIWSLPRFFPAGFVREDEDKEYLLLFSSSPKNVSEQRISLIQKYSPDGTLLWQYYLNPADTLGYSGLEKTRFFIDGDKDGVRDVLAVLSPRNSQASLPAKVLFISGKNGSTLWEAKLNFPEKFVSLLQFQDINGDGLPEIMGSTASHFFILNSASGKPVKIWPHYNLGEKNYFEPSSGWPAETGLFAAGDVNKDGILDLFAVSFRQVRLALSNRVQTVDFYYKELYQVFQGEIDLGQTREFGDINGDGISELYLVRNLEDGLAVHSIISGKDGGVIFEYRGNNLVFRETGVDFNINGLKDVILYQDKGRDGRLLQVLDGGGALIWNYDGFNGYQCFAWDKENIPACVAEDFNNDGIAELAVLSNAVTGAGMQIELFDIAGAWTVPYKVLPVQPLSVGQLNRHLAAGLSIKPLTYNNAKYLVLKGRLGGTGGQSSLILYDYAAEKPVAFFEETLQPGLYHFREPAGGNPTVRIVNGEEGVSALVPPVNIEWENQGGYVKSIIYVDNIPVLETSGEGARVPVAKGFHVIGVAQYTAGGQYSLQNIPVQTKGDNTPLIISILVSAVCLTLSFGLPVYLQRRQRAGAGNE